jgi:uncharacterized membrane protein
MRATGRNDRSVVEPSASLAESALRGCEAARQPGRKLTWRTRDTGEVWRVHALDNAASVLAMWLSLISRSVH